MPERDDLDLMLDAALRSYADPSADAGPDSDLAQRILRRIAERNPPRTQNPWRVRLLWAAGFSLAAASLLLLIVFAPWRKTLPPAPRTEASIKSRPPAELGAKRTPAPSSPSHAHRRTPRSIPQLASAPKLAVFPTPTPLSAQERELVRLVAGASAEQRNNLMAAQQTIAPLHIAAISIPSIEPPQEGKE